MQKKTTVEIVKAMIETTIEMNMKRTIETRTKADILFVGNGYSDGYCSA